MSESLDLFKYSGLWVAINEEEVIASAQDPEKLWQILEEKEIESEEITVFLVPQKDESHHVL